MLAQGSKTPFDAFIRRRNEGYGSDESKFRALHDFQPNTGRFQQGGNQLPSSRREYAPISKANASARTEMEEEDMDEDEPPPMVVRPATPSVQSKPERRISVHDRPISRPEPRTMGTAVPPHRATNAPGPSGVPGPSRARYAADEEAEQPSYVDLTSTAKSLAAAAHALGSSQNTGTVGGNTTASAVPRSIVSAAKGLATAATKTEAAPANLPATTSPAILIRKGARGGVADAEGKPGLSAALSMPRPATAAPTKVGMSARTAVNARAEQLPPPFKASESSPWDRTAPHGGVAVVASSPTTISPQVRPMTPTPGILMAQNLSNLSGADTFKQLQHWQQLHHAVAVAGQEVPAAGSVNRPWSTSAKSVAHPPPLQIPPGSPMVHQLLQESVRLLSSRGNAPAVAGGQGHALAGGNGAPQSHPHITGYFPPPPPELRDMKHRCGSAGRAGWSAGRPHSTTGEGSGSKWTQPILTAEASPAVVAAAAAQHQLSALNLVEHGGSVGDGVFRLVASAQSSRGGGGGGGSGVSLANHCLAFAGSGGMGGSRQGSSASVGKHHPQTYNNSKNSDGSGGAHVAGDSSDSDSCRFKPAGHAAEFFPAGLGSVQLAAAATANSLRSSPSVPRPTLGSATRSAATPSIHPSDPRSLQQARPGTGSREGLAVVAQPGWSTSTIQPQQPQTSPPTSQGSVSTPAKTQGTKTGASTKVHDINVLRVRSTGGEGDNADGEAVARRPSSPCSSVASKPQMVVDPSALSRAAAWLADADFLARPETRGTFRPSLALAGGAAERPASGSRSSCGYENGNDISYNGFNHTSCSGHDSLGSGGARSCRNSQPQRAGVGGVSRPLTPGGLPSSQKVEVPISNAENEEVLRRYSSAMDALKQRLYSCGGEAALTSRLRAADAGNSGCVDKRAFQSLLSEIIKEPLVVGLVVTAAEDTTRAARAATVPPLPPPPRRPGPGFMSARIGDTSSVPAPAFFRAPRDRSSGDEGDGSMTIDYHVFLEAVRNDQLPLLGCDYQKLRRCWARQQGQGHGQGYTRQGEALGIAPRTAAVIQGTGRRL